MTETVAFALFVGLCVFLAPLVACLGLAIGLYIEERLSRRRH